MNVTQRPSGENFANRVPAGRTGIGFSAAPGLSAVSRSAQCPLLPLPSRVTNSRNLPSGDQLLGYFSRSSAYNSSSTPWDLLIVDEAHNLLPSPFGEDNQLIKALREITPLFEHKLCLTATPHNGHTRRFSGLLEILDPVRFTQTSEFKGSEKEHVQQVLVRRLKSEINELDSPNRFPQPAS
jgi:hypothetical protein